MQCTEFDRRVLKVAVGQICHSLGWNAMQKTSLNVLTDILERYIKKLTKVTALYCQHFSHNDSGLVDLGLAFDQLGIQVCELDDYVHQVDPIHLSKTISQYPVPCKTLVKFPTAEEQVERDEHYDEHLPPLDKIAQEEQAQAQEAVVEELGNQEEPLPSELPPNVLPLEAAKRSNMESPPFSPLEQRSFNLGTPLTTPDLPRPDLSLAVTKDTSKEKMDDLSINQETIRKTAEKRPASTQESFSSNPLFESRSSLSPVPSKKAKLSVASLEKERYHVEAENKQYQDSADRDKFASPVDSNIRSLLQLPVEKRTSELKRPSVFSPEDGISPLKDISTVREKAKKMLPVEERLNSDDMNQISSPLSQSNVLKEGNISKSDKKIKKEKKPKSKKTSSEKHSTKKSIQSNVLGSPQLFTSPHLLKSPSEPRASPLGTQSPVTVQRLQVKLENEPAAFPSPKTSKDKTKEFVSTPLAAPVTQSPSDPSYKGASVEKKTKKVKKKHADKAGKSKKNIENESKGFGAYTSTADKQTPVVSPPWRQLTTGDSLESPSAPKSSSFVSVSSRNETPSPNAPLPTTKIKLTDTSSKKDDKKHKKEKKAKKKEKLGSASKIKEDKKSTQSLKLTFKRSSTVTQHESDVTSASSALHFHGVSPTISSPYEASSQSFTSSTPQPPKKKKSKKDKSTPPVIPKEKTPIDVGVKIEPLVVNESFSDFDTPEIKSSSKKSESKRGHSSKKGESSKSDASPKKSESSSKKSDSGKKSSSKKSESSKKSSSSKKTESLEASYPDYSASLLTSPVSSTPTAEQSVSRGLFIQTITEAPTTQVWYCPACLRPDDGSPMIGCDSCDGWYHWTCVGITEDPVGDAEWYCSSCVEKMNKKKQKRRKKKD